MVGVRMERGNLAVDAKGKSQVVTTMRINTNATVRGGTARSSYEDPVIGLERRSRVTQPIVKANSKKEEELRKLVKPYPITKRMVWEAYKQVKANKGAAGVDSVTIGKFEECLEGNLYKIWNRMASGSYFPPPVMRIGIPKRQGGTRFLGIPTVADRVAQQVVKSYVEPIIDPIFHQDSYGYRPGKSAIDAVATVRKRNWKFDWVIEFDIKGAFDNIDHELLMKSLRHHLSESWVITYIDRWLKADVDVDGKTVKATGRGVPQGGVISPILMNLFMHYAFDLWILRAANKYPFVRYADGTPVQA